MCGYYSLNLSNAYTWGLYHSESQEINFKDKEMACAGRIVFS